MKKLKLFALAALALVGYAGVANAADATMLAQDDFVGISFWIISMGMLAATAFFSVSYTHLTLPTIYSV